MSYLSGTERQLSHVSQVLLDAEDAAKGGDRQRAYQLAREATQIAPGNVKAWLLCAQNAASLAETITYLNQANRLQPSDPDTKQITYQILQKLLEQDPFILYQTETDASYQVRSGEQLSLVVPKDRSIPQAYPTTRPARLQKAYQWLKIAILGLPLAGIGALLFAPLAAASAIGLYIEKPSKTNRIYSLVVLILASSLWLFGLLIGVILLIHLI
jgi:F0F1-type ATP synthase membrane subunit c/vacuolar-type H+-ATPase subunit K